ncbi:MAG: DUF3990 domain-containing protein [Mediterranea sp.]|jgi:hypothetical protein|nr:DUF3990 domain-containing protein [Mediterranea sp.]
MELFHGSNVAIRQPEILTSGFYKDFGYGFYCTLLEKQARRWASTKRPARVVSGYAYTPDKSLDILVFETTTEEWLDFVVACRSGKPHAFDIVEGPMADDTIWDYIEEFVAGNITREAFWALMKFKRPTHQIAFCTDRALRTIRFIKSYEL